jgi:hypothetical protein
MNFDLSPIVASSSTLFASAVDIAGQLWPIGAALAGLTIGFYVFNKILSTIRRHAK